MRIRVLRSTACPLVSGTLTGCPSMAVRGRTDPMMTDQPTCACHNYPCTPGFAECVHCRIGAEVERRGIGDDLRAVLVELSAMVAGLLVRRR